MRNFLDTFDIFFSWGNFFNKIFEISQPFSKSLKFPNLNHLDDEFVKKMPEKKGGKFQDFVKKNGLKKRRCQCILKISH